MMGVAAEVALPAAARTASHNTVQLAREVQNMSP
jgi:hypothetical protein